MTDPILHASRRPGAPTSLSIAELHAWLDDHDHYRTVDGGSTDAERLGAGMDDDATMVVVCALALMPTGGHKKQAGTRDESRRPDCWDQAERILLKRMLRWTGPTGAETRGPLPEPPPVPEPHPAPGRKRLNGTAGCCEDAVCYEDIEGLREDAGRAGDERTVVTCALALMPRLLTNAVQMRGQARATGREDSAHPNAWDAAASRIARRRNAA